MPQAGDRRNFGDRPDVFKALALGATAVGIGRPQAWGLAAFGQPGVEADLDIYVRELRVIMRQSGYPQLIVELKPGASCH